MRRLFEVALLATALAAFFLRRFSPYRPDRELRLALSPDLSAPSTWTAGGSGRAPPGDLGAIFDSTPGVHKWIHYIPIYEAVLGPLRTRPLRFLEIGVARGGSLAMWKRYLHPETVYVGLDVNPACSRFDDPGAGVHVRIGKQGDRAFLQGVVEEFGAFDFILDDGSHRTADQIASLQYLFPHGLADGGAYLVEDTHANYWLLHRNSRLSFVDFAKGLVDLMHAHYPQAPGEHNYRFGSRLRRKRFEVPLVTQLLEKIEFYDSVVVLRKAQGGRELPYTVFKE